MNVDFQVSPLSRALALLLVSFLPACGGEKGAGPVANDLVATVHEDIGSLVTASWEQVDAADMRVEYSFDDGEWLTTSTASLTSGPQAALLLGIPYDIDVALRLVADRGDGDEVVSETTTHTAVLADEVPRPEVLVADPDALDPSIRYVLGTMNSDDLSFSRDVWAFILDRQGRVVWALKTPEGHVSLQTRVSWDGSDLLIDQSTYWAVFDGGAGSQVQRMKIDGTVVSVQPTPGMHHPFTDMPDGSLAWTAVDGDDETLERLYPDGHRETLWDCATFHAEAGSSRYCGSNTVTWVDETQTFLVSYYSTNSVVEIDPATGDTVRWFGHLPGSWGFDPEDVAFWWQHGAHFTDERTLLLSTRSARDGTETLVREYALDEDSETLVQIWTFGEGQGVYAEEMGEAHRLPGGNTLHNYGSTARLREVTPAGEVVWDLGWTGERYIGRTTPIEDLYALAP